MASSEERHVLRSGSLRTKVLFRWRTALEALRWVVPLMVAKAALTYSGVATVELNSLLTSIIGGSIFVLGFLLAGILADYKEAERMPADIAASLETLLEDGRYARGFAEGFGFTDYARALAEVPAALLRDLEYGGRHCLASLTALTPHLAGMESGGLTANHVVRTKADIAGLRSRVLRIYHIQRTSFLPSARLFAQVLTVIVSLLLLATRIEPWYVAAIQTGVVTFVLGYMLRLLVHLDTPFRVGETTDDDVSLFLLREARDNALAAGRE